MTARNFECWPKPSRAMLSGVTPASWARCSNSASSRIIVASSEASLIVAGRMVSMGALDRQRAGEGDGRFARIGVADFADAVILFAAALEFGFDGAKIGGRNNQDHAHAEIE